MAEVQTSREHHRSARDADEIEELRHRIQALQSDVEHADRRLRVMLRERPFVTLGVAIAAGFILGRAIGRA